MALKSTATAPETASLPLSRPSVATDPQPSPAKPPGSGEGVTTDGASPSSLAGSPLTTNGAALASSAPAAPLNLYQRLLAIQGEVDHIKATGKTAYNQKAISIEDVEDALGDLFQKHRVVSGFAFRDRPEIAGAEGKASLWLVDLNVWLVNPDNPKDRIDDRACDVGTSPSAGVSFAIKRYYKALFHLADEEDETRATGGRTAVTAAADKAAVNHLTPEQLDELERLNKTLAIPVGPGLPWNSLVAGRPFESIKAILEARRENSKPVAS